MIKKLFKKIIGRKARRFYLWSAIILGSLMVLGYHVAKWRGAAAWRDAQARLEEQGENISLLDILPDSVPDEDNFFGTEALSGIAGLGADMDAKRKRLDRLADLGADSGTIKKPENQKTGGQFGQPRDFGPWVDYSIAAGAMPQGIADAEETAAAQFLAVFEALDPNLLEELTGVADREYARITPRMDTLINGKPMFELPLPHIRSMMAAARGFGLRATAAAQSGDGEKTFGSLMLLSRLSEGCSQEPLLISLLVSIAVDSVLVDAIWEAINSRTLNTNQLRQLQTARHRHDARTAYLTAVRTETLAALDIIGYVEENGPEGLQIFSAVSDGNSGSGSGLQSLMSWLIPSGWIDQNRATYVNWALDYVILPARDGGFPEMMDASEALIQKIEGSRSKVFIDPHTVVPVIAMPATSPIVRKVVRADARQALAVTSCALERYYITNGNRYPETLDALVPDYLDSVPVDPCDGESIRYRTEGDRYRLWSVAIDGEDDNGIDGSSEDDNNASNASDYEGDWLWRFTGS